MPEVYSLEALHARLEGAAHDQAHRALDDCRATLKVVNACVDRLRASRGITQVLRALPVPEFQLIWPPEPVDLKAYTPHLNAVLSTDAHRGQVEQRNGRSPAGPADLLRQPRPGQETMVDEVARTLQRGGTSVIEAPTGTGKTRGYLYPALVHGRPGHPGDHQITDCP